ncbi:CPBP family intramembrane glutamic endopeptidase [Halobaculum litoreum]|uniref:CPBP family intramembrane glutamic endopeptidase n=1 Tax=Halobaculum litoreum TaxID=3031998 RepID=A0ABD5XTJ3_9EURY
MTLTETVAARRPPPAPCDGSARCSGSASSASRPSPRRRCSEAASPNRSPRSRPRSCSSSCRSSRPCCSRSPSSWGSTPPRAWGCARGSVTGRAATRRRSPASPPRYGRRWRSAGSPASSCWRPGRCSGPRAPSPGRARPSAPCSPGCRCGSSTAGSPRKLLRWGLMSGVAAALARLVGGERGRLSPSVAWAAIGVAAVLFGVGHLPAAAALYGALTPDVVAFVVLGNALGGLAYGWLFYRYSLEAAMVGHAATHVVFVAVSLVLVVA